MDIQDYTTEFVADWLLIGRANSTAEAYRRCVVDLVRAADPNEITLTQAKRWLAASSSKETARLRGRALRAFGRWAEDHDGPSWPWWKQVPLAATSPTPQRTATVDDYISSMRRARSTRDKLAIELLWCTGLRVSELAQVDIGHVDISGGYVSVPRSKTGRPRVVPLSDQAVRLIRRQINGRTEGQLLQMSQHAIQLMLKRQGAPSPHAWRRGWAVSALRSGVSEASVRAAAGWASGAMVVRYTSAVSGELAIDEFRRVRRT